MTVLGAFASLFSILTPFSSLLTFYSANGLFVPHPAPQNNHPNEPQHPHIVQQCETLPLSIQDALGFSDKQPLDSVPHARDADASVETDFVPASHLQRGRDLDQDSRLRVLAKHRFPFLMSE